MSDTMLLIQRLSAEQQHTWRDIAGTYDETALQAARARLKALAVDLDALWDARRRELAGQDYEDLRGYGNGSMHGRLMLRGGRRGAE